MPLSSPVFPFTLAAVVGAGAIAAAAPTTFSVSAWPASAKPRAIVAADFNGDGRPDLAVGGTGDAAIAVLINDTRTGGGFRRLSPIVVGGGPFDMASGDLNRDGHADLAIANADSNAVTILTGRGDGTFNPKRDIAVGGNPRGIALADVNGDGKLDILVTQFAANTWTLLLGDGAGGVGGKTTYATAARPQGIAAVNLNHDGTVDAVIANAGSAVITVFTNAGRSNQTRRDTAVPVPMNVLATGDVNRDGWLDVVAASTDGNRASVVRGSASGLTSPTSLSTGTSPRGVTVADLNQDGRLDVAIANRASSTLTVHAGRGDGTFSDTTTVPTGSGSRASVAADFDRDGLVDLASVNEANGTISWLKNSTPLISTGLVYSARTLGTPTGGGDHQALALGDFDEDGKLDAVQIGAPLPRVFYGKGGGTLDLPGSHPTGLAVGDLNGDGHIDIITTDAGRNAVIVYLGDGRGGFTDLGVVASVPSPEDVAVGDFNRDGRLDVVTDAADPSARDGSIRMWLGQGNGRLTAGSTTVVEAGRTNGLAVADFDHDGRLDLLVNEFDAPGLRVHYGDGNGNFSRDTFIALPGFAGNVRTADLNDDGRLDLMAPANGAVVVSLANGTGFDPVVMHNLPAGYQAHPVRLGAGDFDLDGDIDILTNEADVLVNDGSGALAPRMFAGGGEAPEVADFTGDGLPDLLFTNAGALSLLVAERNEANRPPTVSAPDRSVPYTGTFEEFFLEPIGTDLDQHDLRYEWRDRNGTLLTSERQLFLGPLTPGTYTFSVTAFDDRGGKAADTATLTITPYKEIYAHVATLGVTHGAWREVSDATAASGARYRLPDAGAAKLTTALANPTHYFEFSFIADPTQSYKLWLRGRADGNSPYNDSAFVQFSGAVDATGRPAWAIGSTSSLVFNLEECAGCGVAGWGWEDDGWGAKNVNGGLIRFPAGGRQTIRIQTREDGLSIDQIVLSSGTYRTTRPGAAKNDTTILPKTAFDD